MTDSQKTYQAQRRRQWDGICQDSLDRGSRTGRFYHHLLHRYYRFLVPPGLTVLELGCGRGDLLNALKPGVGVGIDFSAGMIAEAGNRYPHLDFVHADAHQLPFKTRFDVIVLSDLVNDLWDVQAVLSAAAAQSHAGTRIIINFFNNMWRLPIHLARRYGLAENLPAQNWLTPADMANLLHLSGCEPVRSEPKIIWPFNAPVIEPLANRFLINLPPFKWFGLTNFIVARPIPASPKSPEGPPPLISVIIPAKNEAGNIKDILRRTHIPDYETELIFVEGGSTDGTYETIQNTINDFPDKKCRLIKQPGKGKGDAVHAGFDAAAGDILIILDADLSVSPEELPRFVEALVSGKGEFINGVRLVYPLEDRSMQFLNMVVNKVFSLLFSWLLGRPIKDTLCGTKALWEKDYRTMREKPDSFSLEDPFGDFELLFNAAGINLKIIDLPVRYRRRKYGTSSTRRWHHGWILVKMAFLAARRLKFI